MVGGQDFYPNRGDNVLLETKPQQSFPEPQQVDFGHKRNQTNGDLGDRDGKGPIVCQGKLSGSAGNKKNKSVKISDTILLIMFCFLHYIWQCFQQMTLENCG